MTAATKTCGKCDRDLPLEAFAKRTKSKDGRQNWCRECMTKRTRGSAEAEQQQAYREAMAALRREQMPRFRQLYEAALARIRGAS